MFGQSLRKSRSRSRRLVTKSLISEGGSGLLLLRPALVVVVVAVAVVVVLTDKLRETVAVAAVVAVMVEVCEVGRDIL